MRQIKRRIWLIGLFALLMSVTIAAKSYQMRTAGQPIGLESYRLISQIDLPEVDDLSGLTFNPLTKSLFAVSNGPPQVLEISLDGRVKRIIKLKGFSDTEGITHIAGNQFALVEERKRRVVFIFIDQMTTKINIKSSEKHTLALAGKANKGLEGIAWSARHGLLLAKEDEPEQLYQFSLDLGAVKNSHSLFQLSQQRTSLGDVAGLHSLDNGNTLLLSEASRTLIELSPTGQELSRKIFGWRISDPFRSFDYIRQPEGVTVSDDGRLFVVSEPNQLFVFTKS